MKITPLLYVPPFVDVYPLSCKRTYRLWNISRCFVLFAVVYSRSVVRIFTLYLIRVSCAFKLNLCLFFNHVVSTFVAYLHFHLRVLTSLFHWHDLSLLTFRSTLENDLFSFILNFKMNIIISLQSWNIVLQIKGFYD